MLRSVLALSALAGLAAAQTTGPTGYGRFPCTLVNGDGSFSANPDLCTADNLIAPGANSPDAEDQGNSVTPTNPECVQQPDGAQFGYFCGITGATCQTDDNCDNGHCVAGQCQGGFEQGCAGTDSLCSGYLYCQTGDFTNTVDNTCGAVGAYCQDFVAGSDANTADQNQAIFNQFCGTGYCNSLEAACDVHAALGEDCSSDPDYKCDQGLRCDTTTDPANPVCVPALTPSAGSRARRDLHRKRNLCPASHEACSVPGSKGFECIDTTSNLEQCGACASAGGVDCTALPGVESVGCVAGTCEIWACAEGFSWDAASSSCQA